MGGWLTRAPCIFHEEQGKSEKEERDTFDPWIGQEVVKKEVVWNEHVKKKKRKSSPSPFLFPPLHVVKVTKHEKGEKKEEGKKNKESRMSSYFVSRPFAIEK